jgi:hypothetical protein
MKYYRLKDDINHPNRWYLGDVKGLDNWELISSDFKADTTYEIEVTQCGGEMDFTQTNAYAIPIVSEEVKKSLECYEELNFVSLKIVNKDCSQKYFAMIILESVKCVDESKSEFQKFEDNDPVRPDKAGEYRGFIKLWLNTERIIGVNVFRLKKFETAIIVSEVIKDRLEKLGLIGMRFYSVT